MKPAKPGDRFTVGWREWVGLPELGVSHIKAKLDTGAKTSALHAFDIEAFRKGGEDWVRFNIHPAQRDDSLSVACEAKVADRRHVTNSGGHREERYVIRTELKMGEETWPIELTLTGRDEMGFRMLIGRSAMHRRLGIDPARSFQANKKPRRAAPKTAGGTTRNKRAKRRITKDSGEAAIFIGRKDDEEE